MYKVKDNKKINVWYDNDKQVETGGYITDKNLKDLNATKNYSGLLEYIASKDTLEYEDIQQLQYFLSDKFYNKYEIS